MREKLGKLAFPAEATLIRERQRDAANERRLRRAAPREAIVIMYQEQWEEKPVGPKPTKVVENLSAEDAETKMEEDCVICMDKHAMVDSSLVKCGHRFGAECFEKWSKKHGTCPLCRTWCTEITEYTRF